MDADYLKIGDRVYGITPIQAENVDVNEELKEYYKEKEGRLADDFGKVLVETASAEWNTQIQHLQKFAGKGEFTIPHSSQNKPVIVWRNQLLECKLMVYAPTEVSSTRNWLRQQSCDIEGIVFPSDDDTVLIQIKPIFHIPLLLAYDKRSDTLYTPFVETIHTMSQMNVCTGNYKASDFWRLNNDRLEKEINRINTFSPATHTVHYAGLRFPLQKMINKDTITAVVRRDGVEWRT